MSTRKQLRAQRKERNAQKDYVLKRIFGIDYKIPKTDIRTFEAGDVYSGMAIRYCVPLPAFPNKKVYIDGGKKVLEPSDMVEMCLNFALKIGAKKLMSSSLEEITEPAYRFLLEHGF